MYVLFFCATQRAFVQWLYPHTQSVYRCEYLQVFVYTHKYIETDLMYNLKLSNIQYTYVGVNMRICVSIHFYACKYIYTYMHMYICMHVCTYEYIYIHAHICICIYTYIWDIDTWTHTSIHIHVCSFIQQPMRAYTNKYTHTHINAHTHICTFTPKHMHTHTPISTPTHT